MKTFNMFRALGFLLISVLLSATCRAMLVDLDVYAAGSGSITISANGSSCPLSFTSAAGVWNMSTQGLLGFTITIQEGQLYNVTVASSGVSDYKIIAHPNKNNTHVYTQGSQLLLNERALSVIPKADVDAGAGVFTIRSNFSDLGRLGELNLDSFAAHRCFRFDLGTDKSGYSGGSLLFFWGSYMGFLPKMSFVSGIATLDQVSSSSHIQALSASGYVDAVIGTNTYSVSIYKYGTSVIPKGGDGYYQFTAGNLSSTGTVLIATYTIATGSTSGTYAASNSFFGPPKIGNTVAVTRTIGSEVSSLQFEDYDFSQETVLQQMNPNRRLINHEHCVRMWPWRKQGTSLGRYTEFLYHSTMILTDGQGIWQGISIARNVYSGLDKSSTLVYSDLNTYPNGDFSCDQNPSKSTVGGVNVVTDSTYNPPWDTAGYGIPGYRFTKTFEPDGFTELYGHYLYAPGGNWGGLPIYLTGEVKQKRAAFLDGTLGSPTDVITDYTYTSILNGAKNAPSLVVSKQNGVEVGRVAYAYTQGSFNGLETLQTTQSDYFSSSGSLSKTKIEFSSRAADKDLCGRALYLARPDGSATSFIYQRGTMTTSGVWNFDGSSFGTGNYVRILELSGKVGSGNSSAFGSSMVPLTLEADNAIAKETIMDPCGRVCRESSYLYTSGTFVLMSAKYSSYDQWGNLVLQADVPPSQSGGRIFYAASYAGYVKTTETDGYGAVSDIVADNYYRIYTSTRRAASGGVYTKAAKATTYVYDSDSRVLSTTVSSSGYSDSVGVSSTYDTYGRMLTHTEQVNLTTSTAYNWDSFTTTVTNPDAGTKVSVTYADGKIKSVSGTSVPDVSYSYAYDGSGNLQTTETFSTGQWKRTTTDHIGRVISVETPTQSSGKQVLSNTYNSLGQLSAVAVQDNSGTLLFPKHLYQYDTYGRLFREGLDSNNDGSISTAVDKDVMEYQYASKHLLMSSAATGIPVSNATAWYAYRGVLTYPYGSGDGSGADRSASSRYLSEEYVQMDGLTTGCFSHKVSVDFDRNWTEELASINYSTVNMASLTYLTGTSQVLEKDYVVGLCVASENAQGQITDFVFDQLDRLGSTTDPRIGSQVTTYYAGTTLKSQVQEPDLKTTTFGYTAGRVTSVCDPLSKYARYQYDQMGNVLYVWGDVPNPIRYEYDELGRKTVMHSYRSGTNWTSSTLPGDFTNLTGDLTTWNYDSLSGVLNYKQDAANRKTSFVYDEAGRMTKRTDARLWVTNYSYYGLGNSNLSQGGFNGLPAGRSYSDSYTPSVAFSYNRAGKLKSVTDAAGTRSFSYYETWSDDTYESELRNKSGKLKSEGLPSTLGSRVLGYDYQFAITGRANGAVAQMCLDAGSSYVATIGYDDRLRVKTVTGNEGVPFNYEYTPNSNLIQSVKYGLNPASSYTYNRVYTMESNSNRTYSVVQSWNGANSLQSQLGYDGRGLRNVEKVLAPSLLSLLGRSADAGVQTEAGYDDRMEVNGNSKFSLSSSWTKGGAIGAYSRSYSYDPFGNFTADSYGAFTPNSLNQYGTVLGVTFSYDENGNLTNDGVAAYAYDGENRLLSVTRAGSQKVMFAYDYLGRRFQKSTYSYSGGSWIPQSDLRFVYSQFSLLTELNSSGTVLRKFLWGLPSRGSSAAGGAEALLCIYDGVSRYFPLYDASHNVMGLYDQNGSVAAAYEYDAFGRIQNAQGSYAATNPFRLATKYLDVETGLTYYGYRYYSAQLGRFINRDPIEEQGGPNLYAMCRNDLLNHSDILGFSTDSNGDHYNEASTGQAVPSQPTPKDPPDEQKKDKKDAKTPDPKKKEPEDPSKPKEGVPQHPLPTGDQAFRHYCEVMDRLDWYNAQQTADYSRDVNVKSADAAGGPKSGSFLFGSEKGCGYSEKKDQLARAQVARMMAARVGGKPLESASRLQNALDKGYSVRFVVVDVRRQFSQGGVNGQTKEATDSTKEKPIIEIWYDPESGGSGSIGPGNSLSPTAAALSGIGVLGHESNHVNERVEGLRADEQECARVENQVRQTFEPSTGYIKYTNGQTVSDWGKYTQ